MGPESIWLAFLYKEDVWIQRYAWKRRKGRGVGAGEKEAIYKQRRGLGTDPSCWPWRGWFLSLGHPASRSCEQINVCGLIHCLWCFVMAALANLYIFYIWFQRVGVGEEFSNLLWNVVWQAFRQILDALWPKPWTWLRNAAPNDIAGKEIWEILWHNSVLLRILG